MSFWRSIVSRGKPVHEPSRRYRPRRRLLFMMLLITLLALIPVVYAVIISNILQIQTEVVPNVLSISYVNESAIPAVTLNNTEYEFRIRSSNRFGNVAGVFKIVLAKQDIEPSHVELRYCGRPPIYNMTEACNLFTSVRDGGSIVFSIPVDIPTGDSEFIFKIKFLRAGTYNGQIWIERRT